EVDVVCLPPDRPKHLQYHAYEAWVMADIVRITYTQATNYDAIVIGCFYDTGLREAREVSRKALVMAPCQAAVSIATHLGNTFSVLVSERKCIPKMKQNIRLYGFDYRLASMRSLEIPVHEFQGNQQHTRDRLLEEGQRAIEQDGAEVLILGCTAEYGFHESMQAELGVPVIDAVLAPFKYAEFLADTAHRFGWYPSRVGGSKAPPDDEVDTWRLFKES
ncbi:MAG: aspartate/glutamate racemase family protein, partial [Chloroflexota bacterium]